MSPSAAKAFLYPLSPREPFAGGRGCWPGSVGERGCDGVVGSEAVGQSQGWGAERLVMWPQLPG